MRADGLFLLTGGVALAGSMADAKRFPDNGYAIIGGTVALVIISSATRGTPVESPFTALAGLMLLVSVYTYVPAFTKGKDNG